MMLTNRRQLPLFVKGSGAQRDARAPVHESRAVCDCIVRKQQRSEGEASEEGKSKQRPGRFRKKQRPTREMLADFFCLFRLTSDVDAFVSFACGAKPSEHHQY